MCTATDCVDPEPETMKYILETLLARCNLEEKLLASLGLQLATGGERCNVKNIMIMLALQYIYFKYQILLRISIRREI